MNQAIYISGVDSTIFLGIQKKKAILFYWNCITKEKFTKRKNSYRILKFTIKILPW